MIACASCCAKLRTRPQPSAAILDSQSVKTTERGGAHGFDAGKNVNGRKRHILVDTLGLLMVVIVTAASTQDRDGARLLLKVLAHQWTRLRLIWADAAYAGELIEWVRQLRERRRVKLEIVRRQDSVKGFVVLPKRWIVERTFGWLNRCRRLSKDYEYLTSTSEAMIHVAMINLMVRRLARQPTFRHALTEFFPGMHELLPSKATLILAVSRSPKLATSIGTMCRMKLISMSN
jgi:putative transposase